MCREDAGRGFVPLTVVAGNTSTYGPCVDCTVFCGPGRDIVIDVTGRKGGHLHGPGLSARWGLSGVKRGSEGVCGFLTRILFAPEREKKDQKFKLCVFEHTNLFAFIYRFMIMRSLVRV